MKSIRAKATALAAAASLCLFAIVKTQGNPDKSPAMPPYSTIGHGPSILLLHDSSNADLDWANAARELASQFEVTLIDITKIVNDNQSVQHLRRTIRALKIDDRHIAGSANAADLALRYSLSYPNQSDSFILPQNSDDLKILADIINSTPFTKS